MLTHIPPTRRKSACPTSPTLRSWCFQLGVWTSPGTARCPESLCPYPVLPSTARCLASCQRTLLLLPRSYELMRQALALQPTSLPSPAGLRRLRSAPAGCRPFPTLSPQSVCRCLDPYPVAFLTICPFVRPSSSVRTRPIAGHRPRLRLNKLGTPKHPWHATSTGRVFRGCSHSLVFRLLHLLGPQVASAAATSAGQAGRLRHRRFSQSELTPNSTPVYKLFC